MCSDEEEERSSRKKMNKLKARREIVKGQKNNNNNKKKLPQKIERSQEINGGLELTGETPSEVDDLGDLQTKTKETKHFDFGDCRELMMCLLQHMYAHTRTLTSSCGWCLAPRSRPAGAFYPPVEDQHRTRGMRSREKAVMVMVMSSSESERI